MKESNPIIFSAKAAARYLSVWFAAATFASACLAGSLIQEASAYGETRPNPYQSDETARRAGAKLFARECAACHGANREGGRGVPPLNGADVRNADPGILFWILRNGSLSRGMPSFAHLPGEQRWQIITFLQSGTERAAGPRR